MDTRPLPDQAALIVNAQSRRGRDLFIDAKQHLQDAGITLLSARAISEPGELAGAVRDAVQNGAPMVIVGGGDGTLSGVVDALVGTDCVFGVLPLGTANSFARSLDLPLDLDGAVDAIANGHRKRVDLGKIDGDYFVNGASIGLSTMIAETVPHALKRYAGRVGYFAWAIKSAIRFRPFELQLDDGRTVKRLWATELRILNGCHHGGVELSEKAGVNTRQLLVQAVVGTSKLALARDWYAKFFKLRRRDAGSRDFLGEEFRITTTPPQRISIDGEVLACTPVIAKVAPAAIDVAVASRD